MGISSTDSILKMKITFMTGKNVNILQMKAHLEDQGIDLRIILK
jgi:hypothetical protein